MCRAAAAVNRGNAQDQSAGGAEGSRGCWTGLGVLGVTGRFIHACALPGAPSQPHLTCQAIRSLGGEVPATNPNRKVESRCTPNKAVQNLFAPLREAPEPPGNAPCTGHSTLACCASEALHSPHQPKRKSVRFHQAPRMCFFFKVNANWHTVGRQQHQGFGHSERQKNEVCGCRHLGESAMGVGQPNGVSAQTGACDQQGRTTVAGPLPVHCVPPRAPSTTMCESLSMRKTTHRAASACTAWVAVVSTAHPKARNATLGPFQQGASAAVHGPPMHRRPRSRFTTDRLHVDQPLQPILCPLPPCEPPCKRRLRGVGSERGVAVSMPKSMLTVTSHADMGGANESVT